MMIRGPVGVQGHSLFCSVLVRRSPLTWWKSARLSCLQLKKSARTFGQVEPQSSKP